MFIIYQDKPDTHGTYRFYWTGTTYGWTLHSFWAHKYATKQAAQRAIKRQHAKYTWRTVWNGATIEEVKP